MREVTAHNGVIYLQFERFPTEGLRHGVLTRHGGVSTAPWDTLNFAWKSVGDTQANVEENVRRAHVAIGTERGRQVDRYIAHTNRIWHVDERHLGVESPYMDGFVTKTKNLALVLTFADCQPILAYDPVAGVLGMAHAGWRGTVGGVAGALIASMEIEGSRPRNIIAGLGPAIGACCYEVGWEVAAQAEVWQGGTSWLAEGNGERPHFDLDAANEAQLRQAGVRTIERAGVCTACRTDLFYSYRAERPVTGRFAMMASLV